MVQHPGKTYVSGNRIEVNDELNILENVVTQAVERLKSGGRIGVITFHSLEDRIVNKHCTAGERVYMSAAASSLCLRQKAACKKSGEYSSQRCGNRGESAFAQRTVTLCDQTLIWRVEHVST